MARSIEIVFRPDGTVTIDALGFKGIDCSKATAVFEEALGHCTHEVRKPEYRVENRQVQKVGGRR